MMDVPQTPKEVTRYLLRDGYLDPESIPKRMHLDPWNVELSEWNRAGADADRVDDMVGTDGLPPVLVYNDGSTYRVIDGAHRTAVARRTRSPLEAVEIPRGLYEDMYSLGDTTRSEWALEVVR